MDETISAVSKMSKVLRGKLPQICLALVAGIVLGIGVIALIGKAKRTGKRIAR